MQWMFVRFAEDTIGNRFSGTSSEGCYRLAKCRTLLQGVGSFHGDLL